MLMYSSGQDTRSQESGSEQDVSASSPSACEEPPLEATYQRHVFTLFGFSTATTFFCHVSKALFGSGMVDWLKEKLKKANKV